MVLRAGAPVAALPLRVGGLAAVDAVARLQVAARRLGCTVALRDPPGELLALLELAGLAGSVEVLGEPEGGEEAGVEEVVVADDPPA